MAKRLADCIKALPEYDLNRLEALYQQELEALDIQIIVLDDDPTGIQTVHGVYVYTDWSSESIRAGFQDEHSMFFILTNSRGLTAEQTAALHRGIAKRIAAVADELKKRFLIISRGDSTLRGHYPLETICLKEGLEQAGNIKLDAEILCPFFLEGGRYTIDDVHYVEEQGELIPAGETEFAKDRTFPYHNSDLKAWIEEKSGGQYRAEDVISISLAELRSLDFAGIEKKLLSATGFRQIIVNAVSYEDLKVFSLICRRCIGKGKNYLFRTAAGLPKILDGITDQPLLPRELLKNPADRTGGIVIIGSHVEKTTRQLELLKQHSQIHLIELNVHLVFDEQQLTAELRRINQEVHRSIASGQTAAVYTSRKRLDLNTGNREDDLKNSVKISAAVTEIIRSLQIRPAFIVAKGGITSSEIGTKGLGVVRALVLGQIYPGVPVWQTGGESKFPDLPYVIFPGNVGDDRALYQVVEKLI